MSKWWDIFGIEKRRLEKQRIKEEEFQRKKKEYQERKAKIDSFLTKFNKDYDTRVKENYEIACEEAEKFNSSCPVCHSTNIIQNFKRIKGEIHGSGSISRSSSLLGGGSLYGSSRVDGELDTHLINKCGDCGNEWEIMKPNRRDFEWPYIFSDYLSNVPGFLFRRLCGYLELTFDPKDIKEPCNSLEEKREKYLEGCHLKSLEEVKDLPKYMIDYLLYIGFSDHYYYNMLGEISDEFGYEKGMDKYSYQIPSDLWEIVKKMVKWEGKEE